MLVFGLLTIRHIQQSAQAVGNQTSANHRQHRIRFIDQQLYLITFIQSILFGVTSAAGAVGGMYNVIDDKSRKDPLKLAKQSCIRNILSFVGFLGPCLSFYLCTLPSRMFRHELVKLFHLRQQDQVYQNANVFPMRQIIS
jgi:hypothetical protein